MNLMEALEPKFVGFGAPAAAGGGGGTPEAFETAFYHVGLNSLKSSIYVIIIRLFAVDGTTKK